MINQRTPFNICFLLRFAGSTCWIRNKHKRKYFSIEFPERKILSHSHNKNASASLKMFLVCLIAEIKSASKHVKREIYNPKELGKVNKSTQKIYILIQY